MLGDSDKFMGLQSGFGKEDILKVGELGLVSLKNLMV